MNAPAQVQLIDAEATRTLGAALASVLRAGDVVILIGDLGAGKTTLVSGVMRALDGTVEATSPSFALCHLYDASLPVAHVDCWRLTDEAELEDLALDELLSGGYAALIEWGDFARARFGADAFEIALTSSDDGGRAARINGSGAARSRLENLYRAIEQAALTLERATESAAQT